VLAFNNLADLESGLAALLKINCVKITSLSTSTGLGGPQTGAVQVVFVTDVLETQGELTQPVPHAELRNCFLPWSAGAGHYCIGRLMGADDDASALAGTRTSDLRLVYKPASASSVSPENLQLRAQQLADLQANTPAQGALLMPEFIDIVTGCMCFALPAGSLSSRMRAVQSDGGNAADSSDDEDEEDIMQYAPGELEGVLKDVAVLLGCAHSSVGGQLVHGNLHEDHVFIMPSGQVCVGGWFMHTALANHPQLAKRTSPHSVPEAASGAPQAASFTQSSDIWQLGALMFSCATSGGSIWSAFSKAWGLSVSGSEQLARGAVLAALAASPWRRSRLSQMDISNIPRRCLASVIALLTDLRPAGRPGCKLLLRHPAFLTDKEYRKFLASASRLQQNSAPTDPKDPWRVFATSIGMLYPVECQHWMTFYRAEDTDSLHAALVQEHTHASTQVTRHTKLPKRGCRLKKLADALFKELPFMAHTDGVASLLHAGKGHTEWLRRSRSCGWLAGAIAEAHADHCLQLQRSASRAQAALDVFQQVLSPNPK